jgi:DNA-directed RNA polymerase subunit RPC12/RpoP
MASVTLYPCSRCRRHVRHDSEACPFCSSRLDVRPTLPELASPPRLTRAALFLSAFVAASYGEFGCSAVYGAPPGPGDFARADTRADDVPFDIDRDTQPDSALDTESDGASDASDVLEDAKTDGGDDGAPD